MAAEKRNTRQKSSNKSGNPGSSASETVKQRVRAKRKSEDNVENVKKKHCPSTKNNSGSLFGSEKREKFTQTFDFSPLNYLKHFPLGQCSALNLRKVIIVTVRCVGNCSC